jgi:CyaY protein
MDENDFMSRAEATLATIDAALDDCGADLDFELKDGSILEIEFANGSKIIVNRHAAAREIWVAARTGGFHFRPLENRWIDTRDGVELFTRLGELIGQQAGCAVRLGNA